LSPPKPEENATSARDRAGERRLLRLAALCLATTAVLCGGTRGTQDAIANGDTRTLTIYHAHTKEQETVTFRRWGSYDSAGLQKLNWLLRDWRQDEATRMDPALFDLLWEAQRAAGSSGPVHVVSAYRSPNTNAMLRRRSRGVAKNSQHMSGRALDFNLPDVSMAQVRDIGLKMQRGGVGYYPRANNPWVHLDTGGVRHWPKVSREHLARLFPDEKTVHIPRDGKPMAGFETARAMIEARGGSVSSGYIDIAEGRATGRTLFQILFGGGEGDDEDALPAGHRGARTTVARASRQAPPPQMDGGEGSALAFMQSSSAPTNAPTTGVAQTRPTAPARPTRPTPVVEPPKPPEPPKVETTPPAPTPARQESPRPEPEQRATQVAAAQPTPPPRARSEDDDDDRKRVTIMLPPRRPANLIVGPTLVQVPLPPQRPGAAELAALAAAPDAGESPRGGGNTAAQAANSNPVAAASTVANPATAVSPTIVASLGRSVTVPLPVARPTALVGAPSAVAYAPPMGAAAQAMPPQLTTGHAGRIVPPALRTSVAAQPSLADRRGLEALLTTISASSATGVRRVETPAAAAIRAPAVTGSFGATASANGQSGSGFTGSVVRPLGQSFRSNGG
jgi:uncharacterized protein YcbK (DUF882 family)